MTPAAAMPFTAVMGAMQYKAQGAAGKYNQAVNNRNAAVLEAQAAQLESKKEFDIAQFQKDFKKLQGETTVALAMSGVELGSGSAYNIMLSNAYEAKLQENLIEYNSKVAQSNKIEEANFARIQGTIARNNAKLAQINTVAQTGSSLFSMMNKPKANTTGQFGSTTNNSTFSNYS